MTPIETARKARSEKAEEKREYIRKLLVDHPGASSALILGMVESKFGSSVSTRTLTDIRMEGKAASSDRSKPAATGPVNDDERLEVQLISQLQGLMKRQGYRVITVPVEGTANIKMAVLREKVPGEHVENALTL